MALEVRPVASKRDLNTFIKLPWRLYRNEPQLGSPAAARTQALLRPRRATRSSRTPRPSISSPGATARGRADHRAHRSPLQRVPAPRAGGCSGSSSARTTPRRRAALLAAAEEWLRARGRDRMVGPMDFTTNDECGVLIDGYDLLPTILTNWHHPYYPGLLEGDGLTKAMDLYMWDLEGLGARARSIRRSGGWRPRSSPSTGSRSARCARGTWRPRSTASSRSTTPPGSATGASCR